MYILLSFAAFVIGVSSYITCGISNPFKRHYNNHFLHIPLIFIFTINLILASNYFSPTAANMWNGRVGNVGIIRNQLDYIKNNISQYSFGEFKLANNQCTLNFKDKITGDIHNIYVSNDIRSYLHWYKNGKLVIRNGERDYIKFPGLHERIWVCHSLNTKIYDEIENIVELIKRCNISKNLGDPSLLNNEQNSVKTMEITAPASSVITGTVSEQGQIIHTEKL